MRLMQSSTSLPSTNFGKFAKYADLSLKSPQPVRELPVRMRRPARGQELGKLSGKFSEERHSDHRESELVEIH